MNYCSKVYLNILISVIALAGAINWGLFGLFNFNLVEYLLNSFNNRTINKIIYIIIGICGLLLLFNRDTYLPFLGEAAFPEPLREYTPISNGGEIISKTIKNLPVGAKVIYWASEPTNNDKVVDNPITAYGSYTNQGVVIVNDKGEATLTVNKPSSYEVPNKGKLDKHIHYRYWTKYGITSPVFTIKLE
jgi:uncharacterized membrane protein YuzA (DUF378 family)